MRDLRVLAVTLLLFSGLVVSGCRTCRIPEPTCTECLPSFSAARDSEICRLDIPPRPPGVQEHENLVFCGGGVKGAAYGGALEVLDRFGLLAPPTRVAGTSAGSITALAVGLGLTGEEICELVASIDYAKLEDAAPAHCHIETLLDEYGWYSGDQALCLLECLVERYTGSRSTTFAELHRRKEEQWRSGICGAPGEHCFKDIFVIGTDVNRHEVKIFSWQDSPNEPIARAVRISMAIPYFFASLELDGSTMVDGGVLWNYPIFLFDESGPETASLQHGARKENLGTLGFHLGLLVSKQRSINNLIELTKELVATIMDAQSSWLVLRPGDLKRTVFINTGDISATDFHLTPEQVRWLVQQGAEATIDYLKAEENTRATAPSWLIDQIRATQPELTIDH